MTYRRIVAWGFFLFAPASPVMAGQHHESHHHSGGGMVSHNFGGAVSGAAISGGFWFPSFYGSFGVAYPTYYAPPFIPVAIPGAFSGPGWNGAGVAGPLPPAGMSLPRGGQNPQQAKKPDPSRAKQLVVVGDRLFRAGNHHKAAERYHQALRLDPNSAAPHVRLAQIALVRGELAEAANQFREAEAAEPGWLARATDIQAIYSEPSDFAKQIAKLETHLQADPQDRDAWLVLGAQWFLSGRTRKAADVFLRLSDRKPDSTLAAFLDATGFVDRANAEQTNNE